MQWCVVLLLVTVELPGYIFGIPLSDDHILEVTKDNVTRNNVEVISEPRPPQLISMHVDSHIRNRYARTVVCSTYQNSDVMSQNTTFSIVLPDTAFISGFVMVTKGKKYEAYVLKKEAAQREYDQAVSQGLGTGHVAVSVRNSNKFTVSVNVESLSKVTFNLTYEELLVRRHGEYEVVINLHPGQLVGDLAVNVHLNETRKITEVKTPPLRSGNKITDSDTAETSIPTRIEHVDQDGKIVNVQFSPTIREQLQMIKTLGGDDENRGIAGQFVVTYKVEKEPTGGEVLINDEYFAHFFAPEALQSIPKHVVFVLDVSSSMRGRKIEQLRKSMKAILNELKDGDYFNIVKFHSDVQILNAEHVWQDLDILENPKVPLAVPANEKNIGKAQKMVEVMQYEGFTNIYDALLVALQLTTHGTAKVGDPQFAPQPIIMFLTDGEPNVKIFSTEGIVAMVETKNTGPRKAAIFTLAFGRGANKDLLKKLALQNSGFMQTIYEAADASRQLQDFYKQISSPVMVNVKFKYADGQAKSLTKHRFDIMFKGSELVVAGRMENSTQKFVAIDGSTATGHKKYVSNILRSEELEEFGSLERLWAYLTIRQLLAKKYEQESDTDTISEEQAQILALQYSFVTPLTSLVVVKPNDKKSAFELESSDITECTQYCAPPPSDIILHTRVAPLYAFATGPRRPPGGIDSLPDIFTSRVRTKEDNAKSSSSRFTTVIKISLLDNFVHTLPWLASHSVLREGTRMITIDEKEYELTFNRTDIQTVPCQVQQLKLSGTCTLLIACPKIYSRMPTFETYKETFFCSLKSGRYSGVCCVD